MLNKYKYQIMDDTLNPLMPSVYSSLKALLKLFEVIRCIKNIKFSRRFIFSYVDSSIMRPNKLPIQLFS